MVAPIFIVDSFTHKPFSGNPAAVCLLQEYFDAHPEAHTHSENFLQYPSEILSKVAREMNLSETAFVIPKKIRDTQGDVTHSETHYDLRWFTPKVEVPLCGHATLATAHVLFGLLEKQSKTVEDNTIYFNTLSGELSVKLLSEGRLQMNFPQGHPQPTELSQQEKFTLCEEFNIPSVQDIIETQYCSTTKKFVIQVTNSQVVKNLKPEPGNMMKLKYGSCNVRGVIVTTRANIGEESEVAFDFISRYFAPWVGIDEDPVTGSAHCVLAQYWSNKLGKFSHRAFQASERGGIVGVTLQENEGRVLLEGTAVTVLHGSINLA